MRDDHHPYAVVAAHGQGPWMVNTWSAAAILLVLVMSLRVATPQAPKNLAENFKRSLPGKAPCPGIWDLNYPGAWPRNFRT
jgi:hypothetical protein